MILKLSFKDAAFLLVGFLLFISGPWMWGLLIFIFVLTDLDEVTDEEAFINIDTRKNNGNNDT